MRMEEKRMVKKADGLREQGRRKRGRSRLRWEDCVRRDASKIGVAESGESWAGDRGQWRSIVQKVG